MTTLFSAATATINAGDGAGLDHLSPTDIAEYARMGQCERFLRLRLHEHASGSGFFAASGTREQVISPLFTRRGIDFEAAVLEQVRAMGAWVIMFATGNRAYARESDNARVRDILAQLAPEDTYYLYQPRLEAMLGRWHVRGDVDLLCLSRDADGTARALIVDIKSSRAARVEQRLQVAFYGAMLAALCEAESVITPEITTGILYRDIGEASELDLAVREAQRTAAHDLMGVADALLERVEDAAPYRDAIHDLVSGEQSAAARIIATPFSDLAFHLTATCDGCAYNAFCMKTAAQADDLSLLPHLREGEKRILRREGITTVRDLALLKQSPTGEPGAWSPDLIAAPEHAAQVRALAAISPVGERLDELVHRARRYREKTHGEPFEERAYIPSKGYASLPYVDAQQNANLVRIYLDAQSDYLHNRLYLLGALVVGCEAGKEPPDRRRVVIEHADGPPETDADEAALLTRWINVTLRAVAAVAAPDADGNPRAPVHLIFWNGAEQRLLLDALARHFVTIRHATPLYEFMTQLAAFDSPLTTFLDREVREHTNYPMVCQSLYSVAQYLRFTWNTPEPFRTLFYERIFDGTGKLEPENVDSPWYARHARFGSAIPLEYAYAAWDALPNPPRRGRDEYAHYRGVSLDLLTRFQARRLEAIAHIARDLKGNPDTSQRPFDLSVIPRFTDKAASLAGALDEFIIIERHVSLNAWKQVRLAAPERRVLMGETLLVRYHAADNPAVVENARREALRQEMRREYADSHPGKRFRRDPAQMTATGELPEGNIIRLRVTVEGVECGLEEALALTTLREGKRLVLYPRWTVDTRPDARRTEPITPTARQLLHAKRLDLSGFEEERDDAGRVIAATLVVAVRPAHGTGDGFTFGDGLGQQITWDDGALYTLDPDPNDISGAWQHEIAQALITAVEDAAGARPVLYDRLTGVAPETVRWPEAAQAGQRQFLAGLDALHECGAFAGFEPRKREYIAAHGGDALLLVQGPPGTGKSFTTAYAVFARLQGALAAGMPYRVAVSCHTHAATDVLLKALVDVRGKLREWHTAYPDLFAAHFDERLLAVPGHRLNPKEPPPDGVIGWQAKDSAPVWQGAYGIIAATPGGIYRSVKARDKADLFGQACCDCLVLDEASQMSVPAAMLAALPLKAEGQIIVVGDHRQMAPIVHHDWANEPRRTFREYRCYESLFDTLRGREPAIPFIQFARSFRLHADMAAFLAREVYQADGIAYYSDLHARLNLPGYGEITDAFVAAALDPAYPLVVVVHDEAASQKRNQYEQALVTPLLAALTGQYDAGTGLGVVVPHRAQRAALKLAIPGLAVDTVERFQGDERDVIVVAATESDRGYVLAMSAFLLDPHRLTVALSRAKRKLVLVAARTIFSIFSTDEETFAHAQLWKNLLNRTCTLPLWAGEYAGHHVTVWGNTPAPAAIEGHILQGHSEP